MAIRKIVYLPDPCLRKQTENVVDFNDKLHELIDDMFETMYEAKGVGLAAPQIGISLNIAVIDVVGEKNASDQIVIANPEVIERRGEQKFKEGCLSVPGAYDVVKRSEWVKVKAQDKNGEFFEIEGDGLLGECLQHEIDHLNGKLFIDLLSPLKRKIVRKKLEKYKRAEKNK